MMFKTPKFWRSKNLISILLLPLSSIYWLCGLVRLYIARPYIAKAKVILIGNHIVGGSGKTSIVIEVCKILQKKTINFCVVTYGPGGSIKGPTLIENNYKPTEAGDEALMIAAFCPTIVSKDKASGVELADKLGYTHIIVDDGLQNPNFSKDLSICIHNPNIVNNGFIFPAGPNRESLASALEKSDILIEFGEYRSESSQQTRLYFVAKKIFTPKLHGKNVSAFCSIANASLFAKALKENGASIAEFHEFPDHHIYNQRNLELIFADSTKKTFITTQKDYVKLPDEFKKRVLVLNEQIEFNNEEQFINEILTQKN